MGNKVLLAVKDSSDRKNIKELLIAEEYIVNDQIDNAIEAILKCENEDPDILLIDLDLPLLDGIRTIHYIAEHKLAKVIIVIDSDWTTSLSKVDMYEIDAFVSRPVTRRNIIPCLSMALARNERKLKLQKQYEEMEKEFYDNRSIHCATHIFMTENNMTEEEAIAYLKNLSMNNNKELAELADIICSLCENKSKSV
ncbi:MAG: ANTAR domain-containing response regulator [Aminipila sp.]